MSKRSDWYDSIVDAINNYKDRFGAKAPRSTKSGSKTSSERTSYRVRAVPTGSRSKRTISQ